MPRENTVAALRHLLFSGEGSTESIAVTAVAGMGGVGKTVLAIALCRDPTVRDAFPDGIAWITIGREWDGDFVSRMREVAKALGDDLAAYDNPIACQTQYRNLLRGKAALVVMDDVWNIQHLDQLLVDAPRSRFLFTTRDKTIVRAKTSRSYAADVLNTEEARALLALWANIRPASLPPESAAIIEACAGLPLALAQIGGSLRGLPAYEWRYTVDHLKNANISALQALLPTGQDSFFKSLAVSLDAIRDETLRERYRTLAVLLEDVPAPLTILQTLWAASEAESHQTARYFVDRSLAAWESAADPKQGIKLHDLQLDYVRAGYPNPESLGLIHQATRLSSHVLRKDPAQYSSQLNGRLCGLKSNPGVVQFVSQISAAAPKPWLQPIYQALHPAGTSLVRTLEGHSAAVRGVALTEDGRRAVSASWDNTLKVWDLESGRTLHTLEGHSAHVNDVALTGDGRRAVSASDDKTLKVWNLESGRALHTLQGHSDRVNGVAVTGDGWRAVSASDDKTLKVWDLENGRVLHTLEGHAEAVYDVAVTVDGRFAVSASCDDTLKVWGLESGRVLRTLEGTLTLSLAWR